MALSGCAARSPHPRRKAPIGYMNYRTLRNQHGSTLVESLVALSLFALTAAAIGDLLTREIHLEGTNNTTTTAIFLAERELEDLRSQDYDTVASRSSTSTVEGATYSLQTTVVPDSPAPSMKSVTTNVTWTDARGPQSYDVYAIYSDTSQPPARDPRERDDD